LFPDIGDNAAIALSSKSRLTGASILWKLLHNQRNGSFRELVAMRISLIVIAAPEAAA